jgi:hypothetical protein
MAKRKNPHAVALSRLGARKGGLARAAKLSQKERSMIAKRAADARWNWRASVRRRGETFTIHYPLDDDHAGRRVVRGDQELRRILRRQGLAPEEIQRAINLEDGKGVLLL